ncbi:hypothetical protein [Pseudomonas fluorescens]|uniref:Uncharacterized protein n=1 Tax=Pseudomonas fluorescens TaxID=294 RepID=A0A0F4V6V1_PSEFL|nr:hypothetical protein [Pseudomonas fluorescens]KJZ64573.1 hypothetical protein VD17_17005 [Pseudomonas fluorescens]
MSINLAGNTALAALPPAGGQGGVAASQSLFEHMANTAKSVPEGGGPQQLGDNLMERLNSFIDRSRGFTERTEVLEKKPTPAAQASSAGAEKTAAPGTETPKPVGEKQMDQLVQSLGKMFDYSIETQMVVRGATQISGAANTLLKGQ